MLRQSGVVHRLAPPTDPVRIRQALNQLRQQVRNSNATRPEGLHLSPFTREQLTRSLAEALDGLMAGRKTAAALAGWSCAPANSC